MPTPNPPEHLGNLCRFSQVGGEGVGPPTGATDFGSPRLDVFRRAIDEDEIVAVGGQAVGHRLAHLTFPADAGKQSVSHSAKDNARLERNALPAGTNRVYERGK